MRAQWALAGPLQLSAFSYLVPFAVTPLFSIDKTLLIFKESVQMALFSEAYQV